MKKLNTLLRSFKPVFFLFFLFLSLVSFAQTEQDPDMPDFSKIGITKEEFMNRRAEAIAAKRGVEDGKPFNPMDRINAIKTMEKQIQNVNTLQNTSNNSLLGAWTEIGPNPIPNGQVVSGSQLPVSGRTISIAVHPTNPDIVYLICLILIKI